MKISGLQRVTASDFPGRLAAIVFTQGCNFHCPFCHNSSLLPMDADTLIGEDTVFAFLQKRQKLLDGLVISGGEPCLQKGLFGFCRKVKDMGFAVKLDTNGSRPDVLARLIGEELVDGVDMDLKAPLEKELYDRLAGVSVDLTALGRSVELLRNARLPHRFRTTYVPGLLDEPSIRELARFVAPSSEYVLQPFDPRRTLDAALGEISPPGDEEMGRLRELIPAAAG